MNFRRWLEVAVAPTIGAPVIDPKKKAADAQINAAASAALTKGQPVKPAVAGAVQKALTSQQIKPKDISNYVDDDDANPKGGAMMMKKMMKKKMKK